MSKEFQAEPVEIGRHENDWNEERGQQRVVLIATHKVKNRMAEFGKKLGRHRRIDADYEKQKRAK